MAEKNENEGNAWYNVLQRIDRRIIYLVVFLLVSIPFFVSIPVRMEISPVVKSLYDRVEMIAEENKRSGEEKVVLLAMDWSPSVKAENEPQTAAMIEHLFRRGVKFILMSHVLPEGPLMAERIAETTAKRLGKKYGEDWVNFGYRRMATADFRAFVEDIYVMIEKDFRGTPIRDVPVMKNVSSLRDVALVFCVTGSSAHYWWIFYAQPVVRCDIGVGVTAIIGPEVRPLIDAGQVVGMMEGLSGAAQYEQLLKNPARGTRGMASQNLVHLWVIVAMALGNIGYVMERRRRKERMKELE